MPIWSKKKSKTAQRREANEKPAAKKVLSAEGWRRRMKKRLIKK